MPNYKYRCVTCDHVEYFDLPISFEPSKKLDCEGCGDISMTRRISRSQFPEKVGKVWAGDWFKQTYGHDMTEGAQRRVAQREQYERDKRAVEKDGVKITHRSRQVGGEKRINIPDKKDE